MKREFFPACAQSLNLKVIVSMKHVTQKRLIDNFYGRTEELLHYLTWVWLSGKWILCLLSGWIVDVLFSIYNWKNLEECCQNQDVGTEKGWFFFFLVIPQWLWGMKRISSYATTTSVPHHCFLPSKTSAQSWLVASTLRHEPFPGQDIMNTVQGWECSLSQASG